MSCALDAIRELFKKTDTRWPRSKQVDSVRNILEWGYNNLDASDQAKMLVSLLRKLNKSQSQKGVYGPNKFSLVFVHSNNKNYDGHCLALYRSYERIHRFCAYENNWRVVCDPVTGFQFNTRDWITAFNSNDIETPFKFSFFMTSDGYSVYVSPRKVLKAINEMTPFKHEHPYKPEWEKLYQPASGRRKLR